jgi:uncharacterized protein (DUF2235 family)
MAKTSDRMENGGNLDMVSAPRNFVICLDGTQNTVTRNDTSICRIYALAKQGEQNIAYYHPGVGTLPNPGRLRFLGSKAHRVAGSLYGDGIIDNVADAYRFLSNTYRDEDKLFLFGFSRGAHTARLLASVLAQIGLLPRHHDHLVPYAVNIAFADRPADAEMFSRKLRLKKPQIEFLGLFDSVKSAVFVVDAGWNPFRIRTPLSWYNDHVRHLAHAMAIDERRALFPINRWAEESTRPGTLADGRTVRQVWFPGDHCDVGGGHTSNGLDLSVAPLDWMIRQAREYGLTLDPLSESHEQLAREPKRLAFKRCHDSVHDCCWSLFELLWTFSANLDDRPRWCIPHWFRSRYSPGTSHSPVLVHESVRERLSSGRDYANRRYRPRNLTRLLHQDRQRGEQSIIWVK